MSICDQDILSRLGICIARDASESSSGPGTLGGQAIGDVFVIVGYGTADRFVPQVCATRKQ